MAKLYFITLVMLAQSSHSKILCDYYVNQELAARNIGQISSVNSNYTLKKLTDVKSKEYHDDGVDTLSAYPEGSDPFGNDGYKVPALEYQISITPKDLKTAKFKEIRIYVQKRDGAEVIAGFSIVGDAATPLEKNRVFLQEQKSCKIRLAHNYYSANAEVKKTGTTRGWVKVNSKVCEKIKSNYNSLKSSTGDAQSKLFRSIVPEAAVTEDDSIAIKDTLVMCGKVLPGFNQAVENLPKPQLQPVVR